MLVVPCTSRDLPTTLALQQAGRVKNTEQRKKLREDTPCNKESDKASQVAARGRRVEGEKRTDSASAASRLTHMSLHMTKFRADI